MEFSKVSDHTILRRTPSGCSWSKRRDPQIRRQAQARRPSIPTRQFASIAATCRSTTSNRPGCASAMSSSDAPAHFVQVSQVLMTPIARWYIFGRASVGTPSAARAKSNRSASRGSRMGFDDSWRTTSLATTGRACSASIILRSNSAR